MLCLSESVVIFLCRFFFDTEFKNFLIFALHHEIVLLFILTKYEVFMLRSRCWVLFFSKVERKSNMFYVLNILQITLIDKIIGGLRKFGKNY